MNSVVLKGKLGAGFNDDRYTLPKDGNPGDILVKTENGSVWQKQQSATITPDWNQNDSTAKDHIKNRPCYSVGTAHNKVVQTGMVSSANISISNSNYIAIYDKAVGYKNDAKGEFMLSIIDSSTRESKYYGDLSFISDSNGTRQYGDGSKVKIIKTVTNDKAYLGIIDSTLVNGNYEYTLYINDPELVYHPLDDGYIPSTIQRVGADVIIPSSTSGSTKKFKITVDDSGTISASEVT